MTRRESRERALELLYSSFAASTSIAAARAATVLPLDELTSVLLSAVEEHGGAIDELIAHHAQRWSLERMPVLDLAILRLAIAELLTCETPVAVVLSEAVELAQRYSTDASGRFVNGVLAAVAQELAAGGSTSPRM